MSTAWRSARGDGPLVDRVARNISDPVLRLRFLKAVAPPAPGRGTLFGSGWRKVWLLTLATVVIAPILLIAVILLSRPRTPQLTRKPAKLSPVVIPVQVPKHDVWLVERTGELSTYSNGLRIDDRFLVATHPRSYQAFPADGGAPMRRDQPAGIVFHTTESQQVPFEASANGALRQIGESLLDYVRRRQAYNFVIDRFGRVYRVVPEDQVAKHAGYSAWADDNWRYINLNESFLGVSFEAVSPAAQESADISTAQTLAAATLVEMLRRHYAIPAGNCVTHAQVSVNPSNMRVGLHVDWAAGFPFAAVGLPDNYATPLPALWAYGLDYDPAFLSKAGAGMRTGIDRADAMLAERAEADGVRAAAYKQELRRRYREMLGRVHGARPSPEAEQFSQGGPPGPRSHLQIPLTPEP